VKWYYILYEHRVGVRTWIHENYTLNEYMSWKIARYTRNYCCGRKQSRGLRVSECRYGLRSCACGMIHVGVTMFMWVQWAVWWLLRTRLELVSKGHEVLQDVTGTPLPLQNWLQLTINYYVTSHNTYVTLADKTPASPKSQHPPLSLHMTLRSRTSIPHSKSDVIKSWPCFPLQYKPHSCFLPCLHSCVSH